MLSLTIRIKRNDELDGKKIHELLLELFMTNNISGCTIWTGVDGFGKRRRSTISIEGVTINMPMIIEVVDERLNIEPLLPEIKRIVGVNGLITIHEVEAV
jgi:PII-like signaling protein